MNTTIEVKGLEDLTRYIKFVENFSNIKQNTEFKNYIKQLFQQTLENVMNNRLNSNTTNNLEIDLYRTSNHIVDTEDGFMIYNDAKIPADKYNILPFNTSGYNNGMFSIALAFEYGTGVNSKATVKVNPHSKHYNEETNEWYLPKNVIGESGVKTNGYQGFEIYRYTAIEINKNIQNWYKEYIKQKRG